MDRLPDVAAFARMRMIGGTMFADRVVNDAICVDIKFGLIGSLDPQPRSGGIL